MEIYTVDLLTPSGLVEYPAYKSQQAELESAGNLMPIAFYPFDGDSTLQVVGVRLTSASMSKDLPVDIPLSLFVGDVVTFGVGMLSIDEAKPSIQRGAAYVAQVRARQALVELMEDESPYYATQSMPEPDNDFSAVFVSSSHQNPNYFNTGYVDGVRFYDFACSADVLFIRSAATSHQFLSEFLAVLSGRRGRYWQFDRNITIQKCGEVENSTPLISGRVYQQMAQVSLTMTFTFRHYETEGWLTSATVNEECSSVTVTATGEK
ncbi:hypothetical protein JY462_07850 [Serratia marcescens]|nr:hypothetical protein [Serratia marcescens]